MTSVSVTGLENLLREIRACKHCAAHLAAGPRPILQVDTGARILIVGQAPGTRVHASGVPWDDASGDRLRDWTALTLGTFYDPQQVALLPIGFCYPGTGESADLPPRPECAPLWHDRVLAHLPVLKLALLVGSHAQQRYMPAARRQSMTERVQGGLVTIAIAGAMIPALPLPHPSWRSTGWTRRNPWFETETVSMLRTMVAAALA